MVSPLRLGNTAFSRDGFASELLRPGAYVPPPLTFEEALLDLIEPFLCC
jgi:hypothetical protein